MVEEVVENIKNEMIKNTEVADMKVEKMDICKEITTEKEGTIEETEIIGTEETDTIEVEEDQELVLTVEKQDIYLMNAENLKRNVQEAYAETFKMEDVDMEIVVVLFTMETIEMKVEVIEEVAEVEFAIIVEKKVTL